jgi:hypothetical protein
VASHPVWFFFPFFLDFFFLFKKKKSDGGILEKKNVKVVKLPQFESLGGG